MQSVLGSYALSAQVLSLLLHGNGWDGPLLRRGSRPQEPRVTSLSSSSVLASRRALSELGVVLGKLFRGLFKRHGFAMGGP